MPLTAKGEEIMAAMRKQYGSEEKAREVFYASKNAGTITGVDAAEPMGAVATLDSIRGLATEIRQRHDAMSRRADEGAPPEAPLC